MTPSSEARKAREDHRHEHWWRQRRDQETRQMEQALRERQRWLRAFEACTSTDMRPADDWGPGFRD